MTQHLRPGIWPTFKVRVIANWLDIGTDRFFLERIQSSLFELSHHPRSEKLAYQARSHLQAYYSNVFESIRSAAYDSDPLPQNPLAVIRWRKEVHREDAKRKAYEAARTSKTRSSPGQADLASKDTSVLSLNSPPNISPQVNRPPSKPLHSAEMLNRAEEADAEKHLKKSAALREWVVTPGEMAAYINCRGIVDRFTMPVSQNGASLWGEMPHMDRSPSTISASSTRSRSVVSPSSRMGYIKSPMANVSPNLRKNRGDTDSDSRCHNFRELTGQATRRDEEAVSTIVNASPRPSSPRCAVYGVTSILIMNLIRKGEDQWLQIPKTRRERPGVIAY
jgi:hypothetical protein